MLLQVPQPPPMHRPRLGPWLLRQAVLRPGERALLREARLVIVAGEAVVLIEGLAQPRHALQPLPDLDVVVAFERCRSTAGRNLGEDRGTPPSAGPVMEVTPFSWPSNAQHSCKLRVAQELAPRAA